LFSWYSGTIEDNEWLIGTDKTLSPEKYFIVIVALCVHSPSECPYKISESRIDF